MDMLDIATAVFIGNMITVAVVYSLNQIIKASNEGRKQSPLALFGFSVPLLMAAAFIATV